MKTKEKAKELIFKMWDSTPNRIFDKNRELTEENYLSINDAISSALICVEENIDLIHSIPDIDCKGNIIIDKLIFWQEVKREIEKL